jgi:hypothetical protein
LNVGSNVTEEGVTNHSKPSQTSHIAKAFEVASHLPTAQKAIR